MGWRGGGMDRCKWVRNAAGERRELRLVCKFGGLVVGSVSLLRVAARCLIFRGRLFLRGLVVSFIIEEHEGWSQCGCLPGADLIGDLRVWVVGRARMLRPVLAVRSNRVLILCSSLRAAGAPSRLCFPDSSVMNCTARTSAMRVAGWRSVRRNATEEELHVFQID